MDIQAYVYSGLATLGAFIMKSYVNRIDDLEKELPNKVTEDEVRVLLADKIDPIREDVKSLEGKVDKILDILMNR